MVRINYDSATVNISVFIQQRKILFQNDISLKTMRLGVLLREELNKSWDSRQNHELGVKEQLLLISLSCLSPGWVKKLQEFMKFCLQVSHNANLTHSKSTWRQLTILWKLQNHNIESSGHNTHSALLYCGEVQEWLIKDNIVVLISGILVWAD